LDFLRHRLRCPRGWEKPRDGDGPIPGAKAPLAHRRPGYPSVGLRPRRARLRFARPGDRNPKGVGQAMPIKDDNGKSNCRWLLERARAQRDF
jgi:hypothetical protein